jgi:hypothetical protein
VNSGVLNARKWALDLADVLLVAAIILSFAVSAMALTAAGVQYDVAGGPGWQKLHPATYLGGLAMACRLLGQQRPAHYLQRLSRKFPGAAFFGAMWVSLAVYSLLVQHAPVSGLIETYLVALTALISYDDLSLATRQFVRTSLHAILVINAIVGIVELLTHDRLFPFVINGEPVTGDGRSTALFGHPLLNAATTGAYLLSLCLGADPQLGPVRRVAIIGLSLLSLFAFGGRTALVLSSAIVGGVLLFKLAMFFLGARVHLGRVLAIMAVSPILVLGAAGAASAGMFDNLLARFADDSGSAETRVIALHLFDLFDTRDVLFGPRSDLLVSAMDKVGIPIGIENTWIAMIFLYGALMTAFFVTGLLALFWEYWRRARPGASVLIIYFLIIISSMNGLASKSMIFIQFSSLLLFMFPREPAASHRT